MDTGFKNPTLGKGAKLQYSWNQSEYWEVSWRPEYTCYHWDSCERTTNSIVKSKVIIDF